MASTIMCSPAHNFRENKMTKSYLLKEKEISIDGESVVIQSYSYSVQKKITELTQKEDMSGSMDLFLISSLKSWSLTDSDGKTLPITKEILDSLAGSFVQQILKEATEFNGLNPAEIKN